MKTEVQFQNPSMIGESILRLESEDVLHKMSAKRIAAYMKSVEKFMDPIIYSNDEKERKQQGVKQVVSWLRIAEDIKQSKKQHGDNNRETNT